MLKTLLISGILLSAFVFTPASAKIWRVNNNPGIKADFTKLDEAHNAAASGDTIHLEGSATSYGNLDCTKKLVILGTGYFLGENLNLQALRQSSKVGYITLSNGSAGTVIMGLDFEGRDIYIRANDIVIRRNKFSSPGNNIPDYNIGGIQIQYANNDGNQAASNIVISQNYGVRISSDRASTGILITNNFITYYGYYADDTQNASFSLSQNTTAIVQNNIFRRGKVTAHNSNFTNNIMVAGFFEGTGDLISNNLASGTQFGTANDNQANVNMSSVFVGAGENVSSDGQWKLKANSPAIGAGFGSTSQKPIDAGMFGGFRPYVLSGLPPIPAIYSLENQPVGSNTDPIDVTVKVRSVGN